MRCNPLKGPNDSSQPGDWMNGIRRLAEQQIENDCEPEHQQLERKV
jgi:hypothetical protein